MEEASEKPKEIEVRISKTLTVYAKPGDDIQKIREKYSRYKDKDDNDYSHSAIMDVPVDNTLASDDEQEQTIPPISTIKVDEPPTDSGMQESD